MWDHLPPDTVSWLDHGKWLAWLAVMVLIVTMLAIDAPKGPPDDKRDDV